MSKSIDRRIVSMEFDNAQFEREVKTSQSTLERLKQVLNFDDQAKNLSGLSKSAGKFDVSGMLAGIDSVSNRFSALGIMGMTVIQELTKSFLNFGKKVVSQTFGQIISGGSKRAKNIEQAKFQFQGLGMDIEATMENALYAVTDTAYGLDEAAKVASQLGASGMRAGDDMATALRAVSGVAAMTNSSYEDIGRVFTTVAGNGRLMGNQLLQLSGRGLNAAAVLAESMGISEQAVREMVTAGEISFEMFYKAMDGAFGEHATRANETYSGSLSNVRANLAKIGELVAINHFEDMKGIFNAMLPLIKQLQKDLLPFITMYNEFSNRTAESIVKFLEGMSLEPLIVFIQSLKNILDGVISVVKPIGNAFRDIFPPTTQDRVLAITKSFEEFTSKMVLSEKNSENLRRTFRGLFAVLDIIKIAFIGLGKFVLSAIKYFSPLGTSVLEVTGTFGDFLVSVRDLISGTNTFETVGLNIQKGFKPLQIIGSTTIRVISGIIDKMKPLGGVLKGMGDIIGDSIGGLGERLQGFFGNLEMTDSLDFINTGLFAGLLAVVSKVLTTLDRLGVRALNITETFNTMTRELRFTLLEYQAQLKAKTLMMIAGAIAILAVSLALLASIDAERLGAAVVVMGLMFAQLLGSMSIFSKMAGGLKGIMKVTFAMIPLAISILLLSSALKKLSDIDWEDLKTGLVGLGVAMGMLVAATKVLSTIDGKMMKGAGGMIILAAAVVVLSSAVRKFGEMESEVMTQGLIGVGVVLTQLALFMKVTNLDGLGVFKATGILILSAAMIVLSSAVKRFGDLDPEKMTQGLVGMGLVLTQIAIFMKLASNPAKMLATATSLVLLGSSLLIFSKVIGSLGSMSPEALIQGLIGLAAALTVIGIALTLMQASIGGAAAITLTAVALALLLPSLLVLSKMDINELGMALLALAGIFAVLGVAGLLLGPITPIILALSAALVLLGAGVALMGTGVALLATGFATLAVAGTTGVAALVVAITSILSLIPTFFVQLAKGIVGFATVIGDSGQAIIEAVAKILIALADAVIEASPKVAEALVTLLWNAIEALEKIAPKVGEALINILYGIISGMVQAVKDILGISSPSSVFMDIASDIISGLIEGLRAGISNVVESIREVGRKILKGIKDFFGIRSPSTEFQSVGGDVISGLIKGITSKPKEILNSAKEMGKKVMEGVKSLPGDILKSGKEVVSGFISGLGSNVRGVANAAKGLASRALSSIKNTLNIKSPSRVFEEVGEFTVQGFVDGLSGMSRDVVDTAEEVGETSISALRDSISKSVDGELDLNPKIRPVIDLSDIDSSLLDVFGNTRLRVEGSLDRVPDEKVLSRQNGSINDATTVKVEKHYHANLQALGALPKHVIEQMAEDFDEAIKGLEDRDRINRGEDVVF